MPTHQKVTGYPSRLNRPCHYLHEVLKNKKTYATFSGSAWLYIKETIERVEFDVIVIRPICMFRKSNTNSQLHIQRAPKRQRNRGH